MLLGPIFLVGRFGCLGPSALLELDWGFVAAGAKGDIGAAGPAGPAGAPSCSSARLLGKDGGACAKTAFATL